ncbi:MAG TPA: hypothetical protein H9772_11280, partial [Candidatus Oscillibacter pullicola]|nr:hypothetical protein [Candidatus Oscillibacter pullicola]
MRTDWRYISSEIFNLLIEFFKEITVSAINFISMLLQSETRSQSQLFSAGFACVTSMQNSSSAEQSSTLRMSTSVCKLGTLFP